MPTEPDDPDAHDYAERIRKRLPRRLLELREVMVLPMAWGGWRSFFIPAR